MGENHNRMLEVAGQDPPLDDDVVFVTYNPSKLLNRQNRKTINTFLGNIKKRKSRRVKFNQDRHVEAGKAASGIAGQPPARLIHTSLLRRYGNGQQPWEFGYFIGGLRTDPFNSYPIEAHGRDPVNNAVDIYCQVWAPSHISQYFQDQTSNFLLSELFPLALQHVELFEALVAWAQCFSSTYYKQDSFPAKEILHHRGKAIAELRKQLASPSSLSVDAAIITTLFLMGTDYITGDVTAFATLLEGIHQLVDHCGGLENLGLRGLTKAMVVRIEKEWSMRRNQKSRYTELKPMEGLEHPTHPFRPGLCSAIAKMPKGFRELALEAVLSTQTLLILERMSDWHTGRDHVRAQIATEEERCFFQAYDPQAEAQECYRCLELCMSSGGRYGIERCLYYGLIAYILEVFPQTKFSPELYWAIQDLPLALGQIKPEAIEMECLTWVSIVAVGVCKGSLSETGSRIMDKLLKDHDHLRNWDHLEQMLRSFFWHDSLAVEWKKRWSAGVESRYVASETVPEGSRLMELPLMTPPSKQSTPFAG